MPATASPDIPPTAPHAPDLLARAQFARLVMAVGHRIGQPLLPGAGRVRLVDGRGELRLELSLAPDERHLLAVRPLLPIAAQPAAEGLATQLLKLNADRETLGEAALCALPRLGRYALVRQLRLDTRPASAVAAIDELAELGDALLASLLPGDDPLPHGPDMRLRPA